MRVFHHRKPEHIADERALRQEYNPTGDMRPHGTTRPRRAALVVLALAATWGAQRGHAAETVDGEREFVTHCAVCHGLDGRGDGPLASKLTRPPPDLTRLAAKNAGEFPGELLHRIIDGRMLVIFHGPREMPVWGDRFRIEGAPLAAPARIQALVNYLRSLQRP